MPHKATITRRSGRRTSVHDVFLEKPPEDFVTGEEFTVEIEGRPVPVHVEIPIGTTCEQLYVA